jgi:tryptophanyl-tRNA synthetase
MPRTPKPRKGERADFTVTPWEVKGEVDYDLLLREFGTQRIDADLKERVRRLTGGPLHYLLRRDLFFSHRDLPWILSEFEKGNPFVLYTGRGPSEHTHLGHLVPWMFTKWLQESFEVPLLFQLTDDEKFLFKDDLTRERALGYARENILDILALGFDPARTRFILDTRDAALLYPHALEVAKRVTYSTAKAVFGFTNDTSIGSIFFTAMQSVPAFLPSIEAGKAVPVLIPCAIDQDPHFRVTRDVAPKLGYPKPALVHCKFIPGLQGPKGKMSASDPANTIFTTDPPEEAERKVMRAFTGGQPTVEEQRKKGGNPDICSVCQYLAFFFEPDDKKLHERLAAYRRGEILDGENKAYLAEKVSAFLKEHQRKREQARGRLDEILTA